MKKIEYNHDMGTKGNMLLLVSVLNELIDKLNNSKEAAVVASPSRKTKTKELNLDNKD